MKKKIYLRIILIFLIYLYTYPNQSNAQTGWFMQNSGTSEVLRGVYFLNSQTGWVVGHSGKILKTLNSGNSWFHLNSGTSYGLKSIQFIDQNTGWSVGGAQGSNTNIIIKTTNGGLSWFTQYYSTSIGIAHDLFFINSNTGWVACSGNNGKVLKTMNGGQNWIELYTGVNYNITNCYFLDQNVGWVVGDYGAIFKTTNGGNSWITQYSNTTQGLIGLFIQNSNIGHITGHNGTYLKTTNGGLNWISKVSGSTQRMSAICFVDVNTGWMVGGANPGGNTHILQTTNGGDNWFFQTIPTTSWLGDIMFVNSNTGWSVGNYGTIIKTTTGGNPIPLPPTLVSPPNNSVNISTTPTLTWNASQGATSYSVQVSLTTNFQVITDSATVNTTQYQIPAGKLQSGNTYFWRVNASNSAGTSTWSSIWNFTTSISPPVTPVLISPPNGSQVTTTPLLDWNDVVLATSYRLQVSQVSNFMTTVIDEVSLTTSQYQVPSGVLSANVQYFWRARARNAGGWSPWASAWNFTTSLIGVNPISGEIPTSFNLYQNYPNPFNPLTNIRFDIPKSSFVKIILYDVLGNVITTIVNEKLSAGSYEVNWDASDYPSGVYIYKLHTSDFVDVKKMVLIK